MFNNAQKYNVDADSFAIVGKKGSKGSGSNVSNIDDMFSARSASGRINPL